MTPYKHAESSAAKFGGHPNDYIDIHVWFDNTKQYTGDWTHRALKHHAAGVEWCVTFFGDALTNSEGKAVPIKLVAEQHVLEDCGRIPTVQDWLSALHQSPQKWMLARPNKLTQSLKIQEDQ